MNAKELNKKVIDTRFTEGGKILWWTDEYFTYVSTNGYTLHRCLSSEFHVNIDRPQHTPMYDIDSLQLEEINSNKIIPDTKCNRSLMVFTDGVTEITIDDKYHKEFKKEVKSYKFNPSKKYSEIFCFDKNECFIGLVLPVVLNR